MKNSVLVSLLSSALIAAIIGCSHSTTPPSNSGTNPDTSGKKPDTSLASNLYSLTGDVEQIDLSDSHFDTVFWYPSSYDSITISGAKTESVKSGLSGSYYFDSLPAGNYEISAVADGFAPAYLHVRLPRDTASGNAFHLFPVSWLQATIDSVRLDPDASIGLHVLTHITSTEPDYPARGSVYLFIDTSRGIDPAVASSYDLVYNLESGDSLVDVTIEPQLVHSIYAAGTHVYCTAYASPFAPQFTYSSRDTNDKSIDPFFGAHPGNTVEFNIP